MKLLNYSTTRFSLILLILLSVWAVVFYFAINDEIYDSLDDGLENQKELIIQQALQNGTILGNGAPEDGYSSISEIPYGQGQDFEETYKDTVIYIESEEDFVPVRLLEDVFEDNGSYYKIKVSTSMVEEDDLIQSLLVSLVWLYLGLIVSILILNNLLLKKVWHPFYTLLARLKNFSIEKDEIIDLETTNIDEFSLLNERIEQLLQKSIESYRSQKQFIENASHELQTPLAISINKLELLVENHYLKEEQLQVVGSVLDNLERLTRLNRALLLLSKIENRQFLEKEEINFNELIKRIIADFEDLAAHRQNEIVLRESETIIYEINLDLAVVLISNLLKNALIHGTDGKPIEVGIGHGKIEIENQGAQGPLKEEHLFTRFKLVGNEGKSTGLGLAISKAIADRFGLRLRYFYNGIHSFGIYFPGR